MAFIIFMGFIALIALPSVIWVYALIDVIRNDFKHIATKIVWIINLCIFPPLGTLLYFLIGRNQRTTHYPVGRLVFICIFIVPLLMIIAYFLFSLGHLTFLPVPPETIRI
jgi:bacteriorhodopsin